MRKVAGMFKRPKVFKQPMAGPVAPAAPTIPTIKRAVKNYPSPLDRSRSAEADVARAIRYTAWSNSHVGGGEYDFMVFDYLTYEKRLNSDEFKWQADVGGASVDFYFPQKQHAWSLASRDGFAVRQTLLPLAVTKAIAQNTGINHTTLFVEDLARDSHAALDAAWAGIQRS